MQSSSSLLGHGYITVCSHPPKYLLAQVEELQMSQNRISLNSNFLSNQVPHVCTSTVRKYIYMKNLLFITTVFFLHLVLKDEHKLEVSF